MTAWHAIGWRWITFASFVGAGVFAADRVLPRGISVWMVLLPLCAYIGWIGDRRSALIFGAFCTVLIVGGLFLSPPGISVFWSAFDRGLGVVSLWALLLAAGQLRTQSASLRLALDTEKTKAKKQEEVALEWQAAEQRYREVVEAAPGAMIMVDVNGRIVLVNRAAESLFDYPHGALLGEPVEILIPAPLRALHVQNRRGFLTAPADRPMGVGRILHGLRRDGLQVPIEIGLKPVAMAGSAYVLAAVVDLTERKRTERIITKALEDKTALLNEVHHRVKNNLQIIASLLSLQANQTANPEFKALVDESQNRVRAMALIHQLLYEGGDYLQVDLGRYLEQLGQLLEQGCTVPALRITRHTTACVVPLTLDQAIPCGLLVNELVTNAIQHAFPPTWTGVEKRIDIKLERAGDRVCLSVADTGVGLPPGFDPSQTHSLGMQLVHALAGQIGGEVTVAAGAGTTATLQFLPAPITAAAPVRDPFSLTGEYARLMNR